VKGDTRATPGTDRARLRCAYADSGKFDARRSLYAYVHPRVDVVGWALDHVQFRSGGSVVDVGCGPGYYLSRLGDRDLSLVGIDLSEGMLANARARVGDSFLLGDAQRLPVRTESFDVALAMHMLYHVPDSALAVSELRRVLRPGGTLLVSAPARDHLAEVRALVADVIGVRLERPSARFRLEDAARALAREFQDVQRDDLRGELRVTEPDPVLAHVASGSDFYEPLLPEGTTWEGVLAGVEARLREEIELAGEFRARTHVGVVVCQ
jgi:SAM-dependent methyltransferase